MQCAQDYKSDFIGTLENRPLLWSLRKHACAGAVGVAQCAGRQESTRKPRGDFVFGDPSI